MAQTYTRQSTFADGDTITASLFNDEYNQLVNAFAYSSTDATSTGHRHDGTAGQGGNIPKIGDLDFLNKIEIDSTNNRWGFYVEVSSAAVEQIRIQDGAIVPVTDNDIDLGTSSLEFKDLYLDGTATIDTLTVDGAATVGTTLGVTGATTLSSTLGVTGATTLSSTLAVTGTSTLTGNVTTTNDLSVGGNLTVTGNATISGNLTFGDADTDSITLTADVASHITPDVDNTYDLGSSTKEWRDLYIDGTAYVDAINFNGTAITATAAELNILDGVTSTTAELNILDGVTATAAELNVLDGVTAFVDEDDMSSNSATSIPSQQSVKAYVDSQVTAQDLDFQGDSGGALSIDLDSETLTIAGGTGIDTTGATNTLTVAIDSTVATLTGTQTLTNKTLTSPDVNTPDIDGGTIDNTVIGGSTAAAGTFTTFTSTGIDDNATSTAITIDSSENVGIGATTINRKLELSGNNNGGAKANYLRITDTDTSATLANQQGGIEFYTSDSGNEGVTASMEVVYAGNGGGGEFTFNTAVSGGTGVTEAMRIDNAGNVGIGTTSPSYSLDVSTNTDNAYVARFSQDHATGWGVLIDTDGTLNTDPALWVKNATDTIMWAGQGGNVGIGTTAPGHLLELNAATCTIAITSSNETTGTSNVFFGDTSDDNIGFIQYTHSNNNLRFGVNASEAMRIDSSGNVGIGTTNPVSYQSGPVLNIGSTSDTYTQLNLTSSSSGICYLAFGDATTGTGRYQGLQWFDHSLNTMNWSADGQASTPRMTLNSSGNVGIGTTNPVFPLVVSNGNGGTEFQPGDTICKMFTYNRTTSQYADNQIGGKEIIFTSGTTTNTERMRIDSLGNVNVGLSVGTGTGSTILLNNSGVKSGPALNIGGTDTAVTHDDVVGALTFVTADPSYTNTYSDGITGQISSITETGVGGGYGMAFYTGVTTGSDRAERMRISYSGNVGIGTDSPGRLLHLESGSSPAIRIKDTSGTGTIHELITSGTNGQLLNLLLDAGGAGTNPVFIIKNVGTELMRVNSAGNVGIGTTAPLGLFEVANETEAANEDTQVFFTTRGTGSGSDVILNLVCENTTTGETFINFGDSAATDAGQLRYNHNGDSMEFRTNATERMRIDSSGNLLVGMTTLSSTAVGVQARNEGLVRATRDGNQPLILNRLTSDGTLVSLLQDSTTEGTISVSGTTVSYNGGHLSRWSQSDIDDVSAIYKGTVMSNLDEMCAWDDEDNEQLNKTKVSDVEGDVNVAGVFVAEDNSDDLSDYYLAMTGDMIIRIAQGTTVQRGDLLMSAGDGTAKPQDDDIVRSKTIAKVTSTNVTCTYADGSYCVPCVLMAC